METLDILAVDGNYFGHRLLHGIRSGDKEFTLDTMAQQQNFASGLNDSMLSLYASFNNEYHTLLDNIVFVFDNESWRKQIPGFRPYYVDDVSTEQVGYKDNRIKIKEESDINWDEFDRLMNEFCQRISVSVPCFRVIGCEGDDALLLLRNALAGRGVRLWIFASDGDLAQLTNGYTHFFKNVSSKACPEGAFYLSEALYGELFGGGERSPLEILTKQRPDYTAYRNMLQVSLNGGRQRSQTDRKPGEQVFVSEPLLTGLCKTICGDAKDNVLPIIRWHKGGKNFKVTEKMIGDIWKARGYGELCEANAKRFFTDKDMQLATLGGLCAKGQAAHPTKIDLQSVINHYRHNMKIIMLRKEYIPEHVQQAFMNEWQLREPMVLRKLTVQEMMAMPLSINLVDSATELQISSAPGTTADNGAGPAEMSAESRSLIDDILNA